MELAVRDTPEMITSAAILSGFARLFAEKLLLLEGKTLATGGSIEVRAREGGGTVFTVRLPRCEEGGDET